MSLSCVRVGHTLFALRSDASARGRVPWALHHDHDGRQGLPKERRVLMDGPPYANGTPHLGHVMNKHLKDALARAWVAMGHEVQWDWGWDCHGLPLEMAAEQRGARKDDPLAFVGQARQLASDFVALQRGVFDEQGWGGGEQVWTTHGRVQEACVVRAVKGLVERGVLLVRDACVSWCVACASGVSMAERESAMRERPSWVVPFSLDDGDVVLAWTTTPWTLPLHQALVVAPSRSYVRLQREGWPGGAWVDETLAQRWAGVLGAQVVGAGVPGSALVGRSYRTPWFAGHVRGDDRVAGGGTGVLHMVAGLSELDTLMGAAWGLAMCEAVAPDGRLQGWGEGLDGLMVGEEANAWVAGQWVMDAWHWRGRECVEMEVCWRHKTPLVMRPSRQAFLDVNAVRDRAVAMARAVRCVPAHAHDRLCTTVRERQEWCLSRQRRWGVPMALFVDRRTGAPHVRSPVWMERVAQAVEREGLEVWWTTDRSTWVQGEEDMDCLDVWDDVCDVWFDSGCVPLWAGPAHAVVEGVDQHRGWFGSCLWVAAALDQPLPFSEVFVHGFVQDGQGHKLSKSQGGDAHQGKVRPWTALPTDVVRVWAMMTTLGHDVVWDEAGVAEAERLVGAWRNTLRFLMANALPAPGHTHVDEMPAWDRWWMRLCTHSVEQAVNMVAQGRGAEAVRLAADLVARFSAVALGSWKDRLYCAPEHHPERQALDVAVRHCLACWGRLLSVLTPRLHQEALAFWPMMTHTVAVQVSDQEEQEVEAVLAMRQRLGPWGEALAVAKVKPGARAVWWPGRPVWTKGLVADALGAGVMVAERGDDWAGSDDVAMGPANTPLCDRCRKSEPMGNGGFCVVCEARCGVEGGS